MATELGKAYVQIVPTAKGIQASLESELGGVAESAGKSAGGRFTSGLGKFFGGAGKVALAGAFAGLSAAAAGVASLGRSAVEAYADFQQLEGGIETLYGDDAQAVMKSASAAFQTAGLSANEYMETAIASSASLISSLGGDTKAASQLMDMSITDMADNVNKMGTSMEALQNAYRGFSRGNFTMLDNLALGYAGTKEGMQQLLADAQAISGVQYDISSYADMVNAIHVVQTEMGITGTTAKEASETISGSIGSMKSAWQNLLTGVANGDANVGALTSQFAGSVKTVAKNLVPVVKTALTGLGTLVKELAPVLADELPLLIQDVLPSLISAAVTLATSLGTALAENAPMIVSTLASSIGSNAPALVSGAIHLIGALVSGLIQSLPSILTAGAQLVAALLEEVGKGVFELIGAGGELVRGLWAGISGAASWLWQQISGWLGGLWDQIKEFFGIASPSKEMAWAGEMLAEGLAEGIGASADDAISAAARMNEGGMSAVTGGSVGMRRCRGPTHRLDPRRGRQQPGRADRRRRHPL